MQQTLRFGRIAGMPVGVHWSVLVIMALLAEGLAVSVLPASVPDLPRAVAWLLGLGGAALSLVSVFAHELAHALAGAAACTGRDHRFVSPTSLSPRSDSPPWWWSPG